MRLNLIAHAIGLMMALNTGCGSRDSVSINTVLSSDVENKNRSSGEDVSLGLSGGVVMDSKDPLMKHMRAVRNKFELPMMTSSGESKARIDRFCGGVVWQKDVTLTAGHCVGLMGHNMEIIKDIFSYAPKNSTVDFKPFLAEGAFSVFFGSTAQKYSIPSFLSSLLGSESGSSENKGEENTGPGKGVLQNTETEGNSDKSFATQRSPKKENCPPVCVSTPGQPSARSSASSNVVLASHVDGWPKGDVGFVYTWGQSTEEKIQVGMNVGVPPPLCESAPRNNEKVIVTGIKVLKSSDGTTSLQWARYDARVKSRFEAESEFYQPIYTILAPSLFGVPIFAPSPKPEEKMMGFITEGDDKNNCAEAGDSGSGVFRHEIGRGYCLLGINSARGVEVRSVDVSGDMKKFCRPTLHRRVTSKMLGKIPAVSPQNFGTRYWNKTGISDLMEPNADIFLREFDVEIDPSLVVKLPASK